MKTRTENEKRYRAKGQKEHKHDGRTNNITAYETDAEYERRQEEKDRNIGSRKKSGYVRKAERYRKWMRKTRTRTRREGQRRGRSR